MLYEFEVYPVDEGGFIAESCDFSAATQGETLEEVYDMMFDLLRAVLEDDEIRGKTQRLPQYGNEACHPGGRIVLVPAGDPRTTMRKMLPAAAARALGVSAARINQLIQAGQLEVYVDGYGKRWVTADSVEARLRDRPRPGRPRKEAHRIDRRIDGSCVMAREDGLETAHRA